MPGQFMTPSEDTSHAQFERPGPSSGLDSPVLRGMRLEHPHSLMALADHLAETDPLHINILSKCMPHKFGYEHMAVIGASGSGKSTCINQVMQDVLWHVGKGYGHRAFIWDYKRTARRYLASLPLKVPVFILDPVDKRSHGIDWAREIDTVLAAKQFATLVVFAEADRGGQNFAFTAAARSTLYHVIRTFIKIAPGKWDLTDVVEACSTEENLFRVLKQTPKGAAKLKTVLGAKGQKSGVFFSLEEFASDFGPIAAALSKVEPEKRITFKDWFEGEGILVLSHYDEYEDALHPFQRWVFGAVQRLLLSQSDIPHDGTERTTFFLDEVRNVPFGGRHLVKLLNSGRSKGAMVVTGLGDISGFQDAIGDKKADEYLNMCKTKVLLRVEGSTADWVSEKVLGTQLRMIRKFSEGESLAEAYGVSENWQGSSNEMSQGTSKTDTRTPSKNYSYEPTERPVLYSGELKKLPSPRKEGPNGLVVRAYMVVEGLAWKECATHMEKASFVIDAKVQDIQRRPSEDFNCDEKEWKETDLERLGLDGKTPTTTTVESGRSVFDKTFTAAPIATNGNLIDEPEEDEDNDQELLVWFEEGELDELRQGD